MSQASPIETRPGSGQVIISYSHQDQDILERLVPILENAGWSVWWDRHIPPGTEYDVMIEDRINSAACVVAIWSAHATRSRWVRAETETAARLRKLVPVLVDETPPPLNISTIQNVSLADWNGDRNHPNILSLLKGVELAAGRKPEKEVRVRRRLAWLSAIGVGLVPATLIAMSYVPKTGATIALEARATDVGFLIAPEGGSAAAADHSEKFLESHLVLDTLRVQGMSGFRLTWPGNDRETFVETALLDLTVQPERARPLGSITLNWPTLPPGTAVRVAVAGPGRERTLSLRGPLPALTVTLDGRITIRDGEAMTRTATFSGTRLEAVVDSSQVDVVYTQFPQATGFAIGPLTIADLNLGALRHVGAEDQSEPFEESAIQSGAIRFPDFGATDSLHDGEQLGLNHAAGTLRISDDNSAIAVRFDGTAPELTGSGGHRTLLDLVLHRHLPAFIVVALAYLTLFTGLGTAMRRTLR